MGLLTSVKVESGVTGVTGQYVNIGGLEIKPSGKLSFAVNIYISEEAKQEGCSIVGHQFVSDIDYKKGDNPYQTAYDYLKGQEEFRGAKDA